MNLIEQFSNSLWNFRSYKSLSQTKGGKSFLYILLLFLIVYFIGNIYVSTQINDVIGHLGTALKEDIPDFRLADGKFSFSGPMPYRFEEDGFLMIVDTTGQTSLNEFEGVMNGILITEEELTTIETGRTQILSFSDFRSLEISKDQIIDFLPSINGIIWVILVIWFFFAFAGKLFGILVLALLSMIATAMFHQKLTFLNQWNVAIYASTLWPSPMFSSVSIICLGSMILQATIRQEIPKKNRKYRRIKPTAGNNTIAQLRAFRRFDNRFDSEGLFYFFPVGKRLHQNNSRQYKTYDAQYRIKP